jgi:toxin YoeB
MRDVSFSSQAWTDYLAWLQDDKAVARRINQLIAAIQRNPFEGIGKPEQLLHQLAGWWSRRITDEHRLVYRVVQDRVEIARLNDHYT